MSFICCIIGAIGFGCVIASGVSIAFSLRKMVVVLERYGLLGIHQCIEKEIDSFDRNSIEKH